MDARMADQGVIRWVNLYCNLLICTINFECFLSCLPINANLLCGWNTFIGRVKFQCRSGLEKAADRLFSEQCVQLTICSKWSFQRTTWRDFFIWQLRLLYSVFSFNASPFWTHSRWYLSLYNTVYKINIYIFILAYEFRPQNLIFRLQISQA